MALVAAMIPEASFCVTRMVRVRKSVSIMNSVPQVRPTPAWIAIPWNWGARSSTIFDSPPRKTPSSAA